MGKKFLPKTFYNPLSITGLLISTISFGLILFLMVIELLTADPKPYMGIITFIILPTFMILGLIITIIGYIKEKKKKPDERQFPIMDFNNPKQRKRAIIFTLSTVFLLVLSAFGSFKAYEYTETDEFCGTVCHSVMEPEYTAYLNSPHSKVGCVQCHIGSGTGWYVKSKISGAYQVYSVLFNKYSRPIPTPIEDLRPAQGTCEQCHWPSHFYEEKKRTFTYYLADEINSRYKTTMLMKIGGSNPQTANKSGIHWHMNIANEIEYYAEDSKRSNIIWVKAKSLNGEETIYRSKNVDFKNVNMDTEKIRKMDCIDCHNRPSHIYHQPNTIINQYLTSGLIDSKIPYIKNISIEALENNYSTKPEAMNKIQLLITDFYKNNYPDTYRDFKPSIEKAVQEVQNIYNRNYFPEMNVNWKHFPDNKGHLYSKGCFRCHDGQHVSDKGKEISNDCNVCHTIIEQEYPDGPSEVSLAGLQFKHPLDKEINISGVLCSDCHSK